MGDSYVEDVTNELGKPILSRLPYARKEIKMIGDMLNISPLVGKEAKTKDEVLRQIRSVVLVHIAAQGDMKLSSKSRQDQQDPCREQFRAENVRFARRSASSKACCAKLLSQAP